MEKYKKIDAHIHLLPSEKLEVLKQYKDHPYQAASVEKYLKLMDEFNIEKALVMPMNDMYFYYNNPDKTNEFFGELQEQYNDRFIGFADILNTGAYFIEDTPLVLDKAIKEYKLKGVKNSPI